MCVNVDLRKYLLAKLEQASQSLGLFQILPFFCVSFGIIAGKQRFNDILQKFVDAKVLQKVAKIN